MPASLWSLGWSYYFVAFMLIGAAMGAADFFKAWKEEHFVFLDEIRGAIEGTKQGSREDEMLRELRMTVGWLMQSAELTKINTETMIIMIEELRRFRLGDTESRSFPWEIDPSYNGYTPSSVSEPSSPL
ncbi:hypothetical protein C0V97_12535 [Asaia sp. W19]|uniref:hypothetical protein n=1 Tax=unclassified Asaia TaxID=2685023 RepID=UPI000F8F45D3|nr:hypothetical protein [Asaia sp. W19]RUT25403.1 hypothetical protein C0V97_12535 [Asaia sp. W19]